jgi:hypothetical protein
VRSYLEKTLHTYKKESGGVAQGVSPEFKSSTAKKRIKGGGDSTT